jgi:hypothetical protein
MNAFPHADASPAALGIGASYQLGRHIAAHIEAARALVTAAYTHAGDWHAHLGVSFSY